MAASLSPSSKCTSAAMTGSNLELSSFGKASKVSKLQHEADIPFATLPCQSKAAVLDEAVLQRPSRL